MCVNENTEYYGVTWKYQLIGTLSYCSTRAKVKRKGKSYYQNLNGGLRQSTNMRDDIWLAVIFQGKMQETEAELLMPTQRTESVKHKTNTKMTDWDRNMSTIRFNANCLNIPIKSHRLAKFRGKNDPTICCLYKLT